MDIDSEYFGGHLQSQGDMGSPPKKRRIATTDTYKAYVRIDKVHFEECFYPVCLKVGWIQDGVALETRVKNAPAGWTSFKKKLKRVIHWNESDGVVHLLVSQKVGLGSSTVGYAFIDLAPCLYHGNLNREIRFSSKLEGVVTRSGHVEISACFKMMHEGSKVDTTANSTIGSTTASSQHLNINFNPDAQSQITHELLSFEDVYIQVLRDYPAIFSLDFILEHNDRDGIIEMNASNTEGMDRSEIEQAHELLLSLNLFQERESPNRYHIPPAAFDLAAFKRTIEYFQEHSSY